MDKSPFGSPFPSMRRDEAQYRKKLHALFMAADTTDDGFLTIAPWQQIDPKTVNPELQCLASLLGLDWRTSPQSQREYTSWRQKRSRAPRFWVHRAETHGINSGPSFVLAFPLPSAVNGIRSETPMLSRPRKCSNMYC